MDWAQPIDAYCERLGPEFWAEPLNATTNVAFLVAAGWGIARANRTGDKGVAALAAVTALVGLCSFLFHTTAIAATAVADVASGGLFIVLAFAMLMRRAAGLTVSGTTLATAAFFAASVILALAARPLMGLSAAFLGPLLALVSLGRGLVAINHPAGRWLLAAAAAFATALAFRMADIPECPRLPSGTHFVWHLVNALVLGLVMRAVSAASAR